MKYRLKVIKELIDDNYLIDLILINTEKSQQSCLECWTGTVYKKITEKSILNVLRNMQLFRLIYRYSEKNNLEGITVVTVIDKILTEKQVKYIMKNKCLANNIDLLSKNIYWRKNFFNLEDDEI